MGKVIGEQWMEWGGFDLYTGLKERIIIANHCYSPKHWSLGFQVRYGVDSKNPKTDEGATGNPGLAGKQCKFTMAVEAAHVIFLCQYLLS